MPVRLETTLKRHFGAASIRLNRVMRLRLQTVLSTFGGPSASPTSDLINRVAHELSTGCPDRWWLALAVLSAELPDQSDVLRVCRKAELDGPRAALATILSPVDRLGSRLRVEVVTDKVVVDINHTSETDFFTGIQRVAREVARRWERTHDVVLVGWMPGYTALRRLPASAIEGTSSSARVGDRTDVHVDTVVVPWKCTYVVPELLGETGRVERFHSLARFSGNSCSAIGFDCVPLTTAETVHEGMGGYFAKYLAALARTDRVAAISESAANEFRGWQKMLTGAGLTGPDIAAVPLPVESSPFDETTLEAARDRLALIGMPMVLVVGSHEPRKNHLAVLHAAEVLWRDGLQFSLLFVGGNSWNSERFTARLHDLQSKGRPVNAVRALSDENLWAAYKIAHCTLFPSLNEGFGLPVAESIASGTPIITSNFGSMREIAEEGGALLVDPRNDHDIADALKRLLTDAALHAALVREAKARPLRTWDQYADETWHVLVDSIGRGP
jgi:glycosyltransferase involved in cell wall biosynthesis